MSKLLGADSNLLEETEPKTGNILISNIYIIFNGQDFINTHFKKTLQKNGWTLVSVAIFYQLLRLNHEIQHVLWDMNSTKWCNGLYIEFRQNFTKETFSYDEHLKSQNIKY